MPGYGYSTPYSGMAGGPLPAGYLEAATLPGKYLAKGITDLGAGISGALKKYQQDKEERQFAQTGMESAVAQYVQAHPAEDKTVEPWKALVGVLGDDVVKKMSSGKMHTADMLAVKNTLDTYTKSQADRLALEDAMDESNQQKMVRQYFQNEKQTKTVGTPGAIDEEGLNAAIDIVNQQSKANPGQPVALPDPEQYRGPTTFQEVPLTPQERAQRFGDFARQYGITRKSPLAQAVEVLHAGQEPVIGSMAVPGATVITEDGRYKAAVPERQPKEAGRLTGEMINRLSGVGNARNDLAAIRNNAAAAAAGQGGTGPLWGWLRSKNPWDIKAADLTRLINGATPNLARVLGEVGVLTDTDIERYKQQYPNIKTPAEAINRIADELEAKLTKAHSSYLDALRKSGYDVSQWEKDAASGDDSSGGSPPAAYWFNPATRKVEPKPKR